MQTAPKAEFRLNFSPILQLLQQRLPNLMAIYAFGSQIAGTADKNSDLDLAVLVAGYADVIELWDISSDIAELANCEVDLLDFRAASTVMQYQILTTGKRLFATDYNVDIYEAAVLSEMTKLNEARAGLLSDIREEGAVYGRK